jgi:hypothetical protein
VKNEGGDIFLENSKDDKEEAILWAFLESLRRHFGRQCCPTDFSIFVSLPLQLA